MTSCPTHEQLVQLLAARLESADQERLETHLAHCSPCRERLDLLTSAGAESGFSAAPNPGREFASLVTSFLATAPSVPVPTGPPSPAVPGYEVFGELGRGGLGVVYRARHLQLNRRVALKLIAAGVLARPDTRQRFRQEAEAMARLHHAHIVQIYDIGEHDGQPFISMELVEGGNLAQLIRRSARAIQPRCAAAFVELLALAIHHAHEQGIVHRDLKPSNVLLAPSSTGQAVRLGPYDDNAWEPRITDFGLAKDLNADADLTRSYEILGTPSYMAPEQARGDRRAIGPATDVYALGVILYELLTGRSPFPSTSTLDTYLQIAQSEPIAPRLLEGRIPRDVETICLKCLEKEPRRRYTSARDLATDLRRWLDGRPILARPVGWLGRGRRWCGRNRVLASLLLALGLSIGIGTTVAVALAIEATHNAEAALEQQKLAELRAEEAKASARLARDRTYSSDLMLVRSAWAVPNVPQVRELLDAQLPQNTDGFERRGFEWYYWHRLSHLELATFEGHNRIVRCVAYSPDGQSVASCGDDGTVRTWPRGANGRSLCLKAHADGVNAVCYSPDGRRLASCGRDGTVKLWDATTGQLERTLRGHKGGVSCVAFDPTGQRLLSGCRGRSVIVWNLATGEPLHTLAGQADAVTGLALHPNGQLLAVACFRGSVALWDISGPQPARRTVPGLPTWTSHVHFNQAGLLACGAQAGSEIWDTEAGRKLVTLPQSVATIPNLTFGPCGKLLAVTGADSTIRIWTALRRELEVTLRGHAGSVSSVAFHPDGTQLVSGSHDGTVKVWRTALEQEVVTLLPPGAAFRLSFGKNGQLLASAGSEHIIRLWDARWGGQLATLVGHTSAVAALCFSPDGAHLASGADDHSVRVWDVDTRKVVLTLLGPDRVQAVTYSADGERIASAGRDRTVHVWDAHTGRELVALGGPRDSIVSLACSSNGSRIAAGSNDGWVFVWEPATRRQVTAFQAGTLPVSGLWFSPDGQRLATAGELALRVWDAETGQLVNTLRGHTRLASDVCFSPDGQRLASAGWDGVVKVWDAASGRELLSLGGHTINVWCVRFSPDGERLASTSGNLVKIWHAPRP